MNIAYLRLLVICAAYAVGVTAAWALGAYDVASPAGFVLGGGAYVFTQDLDRPRRGGGSGTKYWRGRRVDDDDPRRWN